MIRIGSTIGPNQQLAGCLNVRMDKKFDGSRSSMARLLDTQMRLTSAVCAIAALG